MIDSDLLNELERKDLIIQNLQKQLKDNLSYFKTDSLCNSIDKLKNELMRKDSEISYLSSKISSLTNENLNLSKKNTQLNQEYFDLKLKSCNEIQKLNEIIKSNSLSLNNYQNMNQKMKQQISKISSDNTNIIQVFCDITYRSFHPNRHILNYEFYLVSIKVYINQFYYIFL